jgi:hypothetical protein
VHVNEHVKRICVVGASGKLGKYMVQHALDRGYEVVGVCREQSVEKLDSFEGRITVVPGAMNDPEVIKSAVAGCDGVLVVLVPWGMHGHSTGTAQAVLDHAPPGARLVFSCGWHITRDGRDVYSRAFRTKVKALEWVGKLTRVADLDDQVEACRRIFASDTKWTVVRGSDLEEGESQGLPVWSRHVGDPMLESNKTRRVDFALFMVDALENDELIQEAPAIVGCWTPSGWAAHARCQICERVMLDSEDYGGDCVFCMAWAGDDVAIAHVERLVEQWKSDAEAWTRMLPLIQALRLRGEEDLATDVARALRSNTGPDGRHMMLDGLVAARSSGEGRLTADERADLDEFIEAVQQALAEY